MAGLFKVGDRVRINAPEEFGAWHGMEGVVTRDMNHPDDIDFDPEDSEIQYDYPYHVELDGGKKLSELAETELELVLDETENIPEVW